MDSAPLSHSQKPAAEKPEKREKKKKRGERETGQAFRDPSGRVGPEVLRRAPVEGRRGGKGNGKKKGKGRTVSGHHSFFLESLAEEKKPRRKKKRKE